MKSTQCIPYSSRAFQLYQEHDKRHYGLIDLNVTNNKTKQNKLPSFIYRFHHFEINNFKKTYNWMVTTSLVSGGICQDVKTSQLEFF
jgi:hypothetical protein